MKISVEQVIAAQATVKQAQAVLDDTQAAVKRAEAALDKISIYASDSYDTVHTALSDAYSARDTAYVVLSDARDALDDADGTAQHRRAQAVADAAFIALDKFRMKHHEIFKTESRFETEFIAARNAANAILNNARAALDAYGLN